MVPLFVCCTNNIHKDPDRRGAPIKIKYKQSDVFTTDQLKEICNSIQGMCGIVVEKEIFKDWCSFLTSC